MSSPPRPPAKPTAAVSKVGNKQIAGVETKWWLLGGGAAVAVVWYVYHRNASSPVSDVASTDPAATDPYGYDASGGSYTADNSGTSSIPGGGAVSTVAPVAPPQSYASDGSLLVPHSLAAWITEAEAALLAMGYSPDAVSGALTAVATGQPLTQQQQGAVASAGGAVGAPPTTVTTAVPPPTTSHTITVHNVLVGTKVPGVNRVKLVWTPVPFVKTYVLWKDGSPVARFPASQLTFTTSLLAKGTHSWWMQATNDTSHLGGNTVHVTI